MMRFILPLLTLFSLIACNRDDAAATGEVAEMALDSVRVASTDIAAGATVTVDVYSSLKSNCETFYKFDYTADASEPNTRYIRAYKITNDAACGSVSIVVSDFTFSPKTPGTYTLRFWNGQGWFNKTVNVE